MWRRSFIRWIISLPSPSSFPKTSLRPPPQSNLKSLTTSNSLSPNPKIASFCSSPTVRNPIHGGVAEEGPEDDDDDEFAEGTKPLGPEILRDLDAIVSSLRGLSSDAAAAKRRLEECGVAAAPSPELVAAALARLRHDWAAAFTFFLWAGARGPAYAHPARAYHAMIAILGKARRFDTAWSLVHEMRRGGGGGGVTRRTILILIRRYAAARDVAGAVGAFHALRRFGLAPTAEDFHGLLGALARYKSVADAEHLLLSNASTYPLHTKSFNIVLNGYCNILCNLREAKRFWRSMDANGVAKDVVSYACMISCFSKAGNLSDVLKLFDLMKASGIAPDRKAYNAVIYALAKGRCVDEARNLVKVMLENCIAPDAATYNSLIRPLCKMRRIDDARKVFDEMLERGLAPSVRTFHAFFDVARSADEVFDVLSLMKGSGCGAVTDTYIMLIRKLCRWRQYDSVRRLWEEMAESGLGPDRSAYIVLIHGLFLNGKPEEAYRYYEEMNAKGFSPEPKTEEMIGAWLSGKAAAAGQSVVVQ
uniref:Pentatricopeptide repeat-containing protein At5g15010, mitochondrial n=1 Tax=Ananas comosus var. bracteatus TaxID=296719 RepID=A0A6V7QSD0_ANACO